MKRLFLFIAIFTLTLPTLAQDEQKISYVEYIYSKYGDNQLKAYVFSPEKKEINESRSAIVVFHGGGWTIGEPDDGWPNPDPKIQAEAFAKADEFLRLFGYIK